MPAVALDFRNDLLDKFFIVIILDLFFDLSFNFTFKRIIN